MTNLDTTNFEVRGRPVTPDYNMDPHQSHHGHQHTAQKQHQFQQQQQQQRESPTSVEDDLLSSMERIGEMFMTNCGVTAEACWGSGRGGGLVPRSYARDGSGHSLAAAGGTEAASSRTMAGCCGRSASPTLSMSGSAPLNRYSSDLLPGQRQSRQQEMNTPDRAKSLVHSKAFPPLRNVVSTSERFENGTGSDLLATYFTDLAPRSMERFHIERGDDSVRFGRWTRLPMTYRLDRARSDVEALHVSTHAYHHSHSASITNMPTPLSSSPMGATPPASFFGGAGSSRKANTVRAYSDNGSGAGGRQSLSLLGDVPSFLPSLPTLERHGTFRTPVRVPAAGMSVTEVSIVQRLFHLGGRKENTKGGAGAPVDDDMTYVIESVLRLLDVPYSDRFRVVMRQTISTEQRAVSSEPPTIDECLACSIPLCSPHVDGGSGKSVASSATTTTKMISAALLRIEFEIQFHRTCMYEDRIRKMLTKKITKLLLSWCLWAQDGWMEERSVRPASPTCMGLPLSSLPMGGCGDVPGCGDDNRTVASVSSTAQTRAKKWQSLSKRNDSFLLWSATDIDDQDDIEIEDEGSLASDMSNVGLHRLEWRNRSLTGKEQLNSAVSVDHDEYDYSDRGSYRGQGIELCLSDDEDYLPNQSPRRHHGPPPDVSSTTQRCLSPYGVEVVYVSDGSSSSDTDSPLRRISSCSGGKPVLPVEDKAVAEMTLPDLQGVPAVPPSLKGRSRGGFNRRKSMFGQRKKLKVLEEGVPCEAGTSTESTGV